MNPNLPALTPITSQWMHQLIGNFDLLDHLLEAYGSPINLHHLKAFQENIEEYQKILETYQIKYQLFFARKANNQQDSLYTWNQRDPELLHSSRQMAVECLAILSRQG